MRENDVDGGETEKFRKYLWKINVIHVNSTAFCLRNLIEVLEILMIIF